MFSSKGCKCRHRLQVVAKATDYWVSRPSLRHAAADDAAPAQLMTLTLLLTNWFYPKMAKQEIIFAYHTQ